MPVDMAWTKVDMKRARGAKECDLAIMTKVNDTEERVKLQVKFVDERWYLRVPQRVA